MSFKFRPSTRRERLLSKFIVVGRKTTDVLDITRRRSQCPEHTLYDVFSFPGPYRTYAYDRYIKQIWPDEIPHFPGD